MTQDTHPIKAWLDRHKENVTDFLARTDISRTTFYDLLANRNKDFGILTLKRFETATGGDVTVKMLLKWIVMHKKTRSA